MPALVIGAGVGERALPPPTLPRAPDKNVQLSFVLGRNRTDGGELTNWQHGFGWDSALMKHRNLERETDPPRI